MKTLLFVTSLLLANALLYAPSFGSFGGIGGGAPVQGICAQPEGADKADLADLLEALDRAAARSGEGPAGGPAPNPTASDKPGLQDDLHARHHGEPIPEDPTPIPPVPDPPVAPGCEGCTFQERRIDSHCQFKKGQDCDGFWWYNESYLYQRWLYFYECPDGKLYVDCSPWGEPGCCNGGLTAPKPDCRATGRTECP
jgi:hypothetical protein